MRRSYDPLHRLTEASRTGVATGTVDYAYDEVGNFTSKSDFSTVAATSYAYTGGACGGGPNAVKHEGTCCAKAGRRDGSTVRFGATGRSRSSMSKVQRRQAQSSDFNR